MVLLGWVVLIAGCAYVGFVGELLEGSLTSIHRVILLIGFILGVTTLSRWIMQLDVKHQFRKIRRARSRRGGVR